jgi:methionyl-tRNA formyltransferase
MSLNSTAYKHYLPLYQPPTNVNDPRFLDVMRSLDIDCFISMYFGRLFSPDALAVPQSGCVNMHPTLLPKYRGQGPNVWPLVEGDTETGQTIHWLDAGIDSGDIIAQRSIPIEPEDDGDTLGAKLVELGIDLFTETWPLIASGKAPRIKQDDALATYSVAPKRKHARIDWKKSAQEISNLCRGFKSAKGAWARVAGKRLYVWEAVPYKGRLDVAEGVPGQILAVSGGGIVVQAGDGPLLLKKAQVTQEGPDLVTFLSGSVGSMPVVLG